MKFYHVICLGKDCQTRWHLKEFSRARWGTDRSTSYFFDWTWRRGGVRDAIQWLSDRLDLANAEWCIEQVGGKYEVTAARYKHFFPHDFSFSDLTDRGRCEEEFAQQLPAFVEKFTYLRYRTVRALESSDSLAILIFHSVSRADADLLAETVRRAYGRASFTLVVFYPRGAMDPPPYGEGTLVVEVVAEPWPGNCASWANAFAVLDLEFEGQNKDEAPSA